ncbi:GTP cyclohydrolase [Dirofilaria immitis]|nr:GTP cyclohydrolase [Dirofilaria immitis]
MTNIVTTESGEKFTLFFTIRSPFSNFHPCRFTIFEDVGNGKPEERWYYSTEQYYMYHKALSAGDSETAEQIANERDARKIKMISRNIKNFERELWSKISSDVMRRGNFAKYTQNPLLRKKLFYTYGSTLVECSPTDLEWGIGLDINEPDALSPSKWRGKNKLGQILTEIREDLLLKPEYAHESPVFLPPKPPIQQCSCPSSGEYDRDYDKRRSLPSSTEIDRTNDGNRDKRYNLLSYPCAERSENIPDSSSRNTSNTNTKVENGSSSVHREECSQPARSSRKRNYRRMSSYGGDFKRHSSNDDPRNRRKTRSEKEEMFPIIVDPVMVYSLILAGIVVVLKVIANLAGRAFLFLKRQRRIGIGVDSNRLAASRIHHDCNVSSSSSEETSSSMGDVDIEIVKKHLRILSKVLQKVNRDAK